MSNKLERKIYLFMAACALAVGSGRLAAQTTTIDAAVNQTSVALDDQVVLSVTVSGDRTDIPDPQLPSLPNFTVYSSGRSQNISIVNGRVSGSIVYTYVLVPRFPGKVVIGPVSVTVNGARLETRPIEIQVTRNRGAPASPQAPRSVPQPRAARPSDGAFGPDVYVAAELDKDKAYVNEQVTLTVRFYTAVSLLGNPQYQPPSTQGFLSEDLPPERTGQVQSRGRLYHYSEIKTALFPAQSGRLGVGSARVQAQVQQEVSVDPFAPDFFQKFFAQGLRTAQTRELRTHPLTVQVEPLPEAGRPDSFNGAVGRFRVAAGVDKRGVKVGEAVTLTLTIEGRGNLKALGDPKLPEMPALRVFDTVSMLSTSKAGDIVQGSKSYKTVLVPKVSGKLVVPSIPFSYFNPASGEYARAQTAPIDLEVAPGDATRPVAGFIATPGGPADITTLTEDILYVKEGRKLHGFSSLLGTLARGTWPHLFPLGVFLLGLGANRYRERLGRDPAGARLRAALGRAGKRLALARELAALEPVKAAEQMSSALTGFLADKLGCSAHGLTLREARQRLRERFPNIPDDDLARVQSAWEDIDRLRFAGADAADPARADALASRLAELLGLLDKETRR